MNEKPEISIIVPIYNVEKYLGRCLDSLISQTFKAIEIICVNDGSTDGCYDILMQYSLKDSRIRVINKSNGGVSQARNVGINGGIAPYIMFCDPDDKYHPEACDILHKAITRCGDDFAVCGVDVVRESKDICPSITSAYFDLPFDEKCSVLLNYQTVRKINPCVWNKIFRRELINKYKIQFPVGVDHEDDCFCMKYMLASTCASVVKEKLYYYILRDNGFMSRQKERDAVFIKVMTSMMDDVYDFVMRNGLWEYKKALYLRFYASFFNSAYHKMSKRNKGDCYRYALPFLEKIGKNSIEELPNSSCREALLSVFSKDYIYFGKKTIGIGSFNFVKIVRKPNRYEVRVLGIPVYLKRYSFDIL